MLHRLGKALLGAHAHSSLGVIPRSQIAGSNHKERLQITPQSGWFNLWPNGHVSLSHAARFLPPDLKAFYPKLS